MSNNAYAQFRGAAGEVEVARILSGFNRQQYIVLNNILLRKQYAKSGEVPTVQIDHLVVSLYGIFSIETKNYAGKIYGYEDARTWKVYLAGQKYEMQNPLRQNHAHTKTLQKLLPLKHPRRQSSRRLIRQATFPPVKRKRRKGKQQTKPQKQQKKSPSSKTISKILTEIMSHTIAQQPTKKSRSQRSTSQAGRKTAKPSDRKE